MKKVLVTILFFTLLSCVNGKKEYAKNLGHYQNLVTDINTYFMDSTLKSIEISNYYSEDFVFYSYAAGHKKGIETNKVDYINGFNQMKRMNMLINIGHSIYLPGMNEKSYNFDGSVRVYYGATISIDTNNVEFSGYQTINFEDGKIAGIWEWSDYGGVSNQLNQFIK